MTSHSQHSGFSLEDLPLEIIRKKAAVTLVIGEVSRWTAQGRSVPTMKGFVFLEFDDITPKKLFELNPEVVLSPLVGDGFDATLIIARLASCNFQGRYRAVTEVVPNPKMVLREIRSFGPEIDFDLLVLPQDGKPAYGL